MVQAVEPPLIWASAHAQSPATASCSGPTHQNRRQRRWGEQRQLLRGRQLQHIVMSGYTDSLCLFRGRESRRSWRQGIGLRWAAEG